MPSPWGDGRGPPPQKKPPEFSPSVTNGTPNVIKPELSLSRTDATSQGPEHHEQNDDPGGNSGSTVTVNHLEIILVFLASERVKGLINNNVAEVLANRVVAGLQNLDVTVAGAELFCRHRDTILNVFERLGHKRKETCSLGQSFERHLVDHKNRIKLFTCYSHVFSELLRLTCTAGSEDIEKIVQRMKNLDTYRIRDVASVRCGSMSRFVSVLGSETTSIMASELFAAAVHAPGPHTAILDTGVVFMREEDISMLFARCLLVTTTLLAQAVAGDMSTRAFVSCFVCPDRVNNSVYNSLIPDSSSKIEVFLLDLQLEEEVVLFLNVLDMLDVTVLELPTRIAVADDEQSIGVHCGLIKSSYTLINSLPGYKAISPLMKSLGRAASASSFALVDILLKADGNAICSALIIASLSHVSKGVVNALMFSVASLRCFRPVIGTRMQLGEFWSVVMVFARGKQIENLSRCFEILGSNKGVLTVLINQITGKTTNPQAVSLGLIPKDIKEVVFCSENSVVFVPTGGKYDKGNAVSGEVLCKLSVMALESLNNRYNTGSVCKTLGLVREAMRCSRDLMRSGSPLAPRNKGVLLGPVQVGDLGQMVHSLIFSLIEWRAILSDVFKVYPLLRLVPPRLLTCLLDVLFPASGRTPSRASVRELENLFLAHGISMNLLVERAGVVSDGCSLVDANIWNLHHLLLLAGNIVKFVTLSTKIEGKSSPIGDDGGFQWKAGSVLRSFIVSHPTCVLTTSRTEIIRTLLVLFAVIQRCPKPNEVLVCSTELSEDDISSFMAVSPLVGGERNIRLILLPSYLRAQTYEWLMSMLIDMGENPFPGLFAVVHVTGDALSVDDHISLTIPKLILTLPSTGDKVNTSYDIWGDGMFAIICGTQSGVGKTRFALEMAERNGRPLIIRAATESDLTNIQTTVANELQKLGDQPVSLIFVLSVGERLLLRAALLIFFIVATRVICLGSTPMILPSSVTSCYVECRGAATALPHMLDIPAHIVNPVEPSEASGVVSFIPDSEKFITMLKRAQNIGAYPARRLKSMALVYQQLMNNYAKLRERLVNGLLVETELAISPAELQAMDQAIEYHALETSMELCPGQQIADEGGRGHFIFWITEEGHVCPPFCGDPRQIPTDIRVLYEDASAMHFEQLSGTQLMTEISNLVAHSQDRHTGERNDSASELITNGIPTGVIWWEKDKDSLAGYAMTSDFANTMLKVFARLSCGLPVVLVGETGTGKTRLVQVLAELTGHRLVVVMIHQSTTLDNIKDALAHATHFTGALVDKETPVWLHFDVVEACPMLSRVEEIVLEGTLEGVQLDKNISVLVTITNHNVRTSRPESSLSNTPLPQALFDIALNMTSLSPQSFGVLATNILKPIKALGSHMATNTGIPRPLLAFAVASLCAFHHVLALEGVDVSLWDISRFKRLIRHFLLVRCTPPTSAMRRKVEAVLLALYIAFLARLPSGKLHRRCEEALDGPFQMLLSANSSGLPQPASLSSITPLVPLAYKATTVFETEARAFALRIGQRTLSKTDTNVLMITATAIRTRIPLLILLPTFSLSYRQQQQQQQQLVSPVLALAALGSSLSRLVSLPALHVFSLEGVPSPNYTCSLLEREAKTLSGRPGQHSTVLHLNFLPPQSSPHLLGLLSCLEHLSHGKAAKATGFTLVGISPKVSDMATSHCLLCCPTDVTHEQHATNPSGSSVTPPHLPGVCGKKIEEFFDFPCQLARSWLPLAIHAANQPLETRGIPKLLFQGDQEEADDTKALYAIAFGLQLAPPKWRLANQTLLMDRVAKLVPHARPATKKRFVESTSVFSLADGFRWAVSSRERAVILLSDVPPSSAVVHASVRRLGNCRVVLVGERLAKEAFEGTREGGSNVVLFPLPPRAPLPQWLANHYHNRRRGDHRLERSPCVVILALWTKEESSELSFVSSAVTNYVPAITVTAGPLATPAATFVLNGVWPPPRCSTTIPTCLDLLCSVLPMPSPLLSMGSPNEFSLIVRRVRLLAIEEERGRGGQLAKMLSDIVLEAVGGSFDTWTASNDKHVLDEALKRTVAVERRLLDAAVSVFRILLEGGIRLPLAHSPLCSRFTTLLTKHLTNPPDHDTTTQDIPSVFNTSNIKEFPFLRHHIQLVSKAVRKLISEDVVELLSDTMITLWGDRLQEEGKALLSSWTNSELVLFALHMLPCPPGVGLSALQTSCANPSNALLLVVQKLLDDVLGVDVTTNILLIPALLLTRAQVSGAPVHTLCQSIVAVLEFTLELNIGMEKMLVGEGHRPRGIKGLSSFASLAINQGLIHIAVAGCRVGHGPREHRLLRELAELVGPSLETSKVALLLMGLPFIKLVCSTSPDEVWKLCVDRVLENNVDSKWFCKAVMELLPLGVSEPTVLETLRIIAFVPECFVSPGLVAAFRFLVTHILCSGNPEGQGSCSLPYIPLPETISPSMADAFLETLLAHPRFLALDPFSLFHGVTEVADAARKAFGTCSSTNLNSDTLFPMASLLRLTWLVTHNGSDDGGKEDNKKLARNLVGGLKMLENERDTFVGLASMVLRHGMASPAVQGSRARLQLMLLKLGEPLASLGVSTQTMKPFESYGCLPLHPTVSSTETLPPVAKMMALACPLPLHILAHTNQPGADGASAAILILILGHLLLATPTAPLLVEALDNIKASTGIVDNPMAHSQATPIVLNLLLSTPSPQTPLELALDIITIAANAGAMLIRSEMECKEGLLDLFCPQTLGAIPQLDTSAVFLPGMPSCDEVAALDLFGPDNVRGVVQCKQCSRFVFFVDTDCGVPAEAIPRSVSCRCGAQGIIGDHVVSGELRSLSTFQRETLVDELRRYRTRFPDTPGFTLAPGMSLSPTRVLGRPRLALLLVVICCLASSTQLSLQLLSATGDTKHKPFVFGSLNAGQLRQLAGEALLLLATEGKTTIEVACLGVLEVLPSLLASMASAVVPTDATKRNTFEVDVVEALHSVADNIVGAADTFVRRQSSSIDPDAAFLLDVATYHVSTYPTQRLARVHVLPSGSALRHAVQLTNVHQSHFLVQAMDLSVNVPAAQHLHHFLQAAATLCRVVNKLVRPNRPIHIIRHTSLLSLAYEMSSDKNTDSSVQQAGETLLKLFPHVVPFFGGLPQTLHLPPSPTTCNHSLTSISFDNPASQLTSAFILPSTSDQEGLYCLAACHTVSSLIQDTVRLCLRHSPICIPVATSSVTFDCAWTRGFVPPRFNETAIPRMPTHETASQLLSLTQPPLPPNPTPNDIQGLLCLLTRSLITNRVSVVVETSNSGPGGCTELYVPPEQFGSVFANELYQKFPCSYTDSHALHTIVAASSSSSHVLAAALWATRHILLDLVSLSWLAEISRSRKTCAFRDLLEMQHVVKRRVAEARLVMGIGPDMARVVEDVLLDCRIMECCSFYEQLEEKAASETIVVATPSLFQLPLPHTFSLDALVVCCSADSARLKMEEHLRQLHGLVGRLLVRLFIPSFIEGSSRLEFHRQIDTNSSTDPIGVDVEETARCALVNFADGTEPVDYVWEEYWAEQSDGNNSLLAALRDNNVSIYHSYALWLATTL